MLTLVVQKRNRLWWFWKAMRICHTYISWRYFLQIFLGEAPFVKYYTSVYFQTNFCICMPLLKMVCFCFLDSVTSQVKVLGDVKSDVEGMVTNIVTMAKDLTLNSDLFKKFKEALKTLKTRIGKQLLSMLILICKTSHWCYWNTKYMGKNS